jgi:hypothetical protein
MGIYSAFTDNGILHDLAEGITTIQEECTLEGTDMVAILGLLPTGFGLTAEQQAVEASYAGYEDEAAFALRVAKRIQELKLALKVIDC